MKCSHEIVQLGINVVFFFSFLHIYATFYHAGWIASLPRQHFLYSVLFCPCFTDIYCPQDKIKLDKILPSSQLNWNGDLISGLINE